MTMILVAIIILVAVLLEPINNYLYKKYFSIKDLYVVIAIKKWKISIAITTN